MRQIPDRAWDATRGLRYWEQKLVAAAAITAAYELRRMAAQLAVVPAEPVGALLARALELDPQDGGL